MILHALINFPLSLNQFKSRYCSLLKKEVRGFLIRFLIQIQIGFKLKLKD